MREEFETKITSKGQVMIFKGIRRKLGIKTGQKLIESAEDNKIVLEPVKDLADLGGSMKSIARNKNIVQLMKEVKEGWN